jgi:hypothetical protein
VSEGERKNIDIAVDLDVLASVFTAVAVSARELADALSDLDYATILDVVKHVDEVQADSEFTGRLKKLVEEL